MNDAIQQVIGRLAIDDVAHLRGTYWVEEKFLVRPHEELGIRIQMRTHFDSWNMDKLAGPNDRIFCRYRFAYELGLRLLEIDHDGETTNEESIIAVVEANMYAQYVEPDEDDREDLDPAILDEFGRTNALYHVWPYWREHVQTVLSRLRLPPIIVPMFRLPEQHWRKSAETSDDE